MGSFDSVEVGAALLFDGRPQRPWFKSSLMKLKPGVGAISEDDENVLVWMRGRRMADVQTRSGGSVWYGVRQHF